LNISKNEVCPRCDYNDKIETFQGESKYKKNVQNWFRNNTTHIENHIQEATHWCERPGPGKLTVPQHLDFIIQLQVDKNVKQFEGIENAFNKIDLRRFEE
jgi:hypothetical protein